MLCSNLSGKLYIALLILRCDAGKYIYKLIIIYKFILRWTTRRFENSRQGRSSNVLQIGGEIYRLCNHLRISLNIHCDIAFESLTWLRSLWNSAPQGPLITHTQIIWRCLCDILNFFQITIITNSLSLSIKKFRSQPR